MDFLLQSNCVEFNRTTLKKVAEVQVPTESVIKAKQYRAKSRRWLPLLIRVHIRLIGITAPLKFVGVALLQWDVFIGFLPRKDWGIVSQAQSSPQF